MIDQAAIRREFRRRLLDELEGVIDDSALKVENKSFVPPEQGLWIRETLIPSDEKLIATNELELLGILQYDVFVPLDTGSTEAEAVARRIGQLFKATTGFEVVNEASEEFQVTVYRASLQQGSEDDVWYQRPVRVFFRAYAQNHSDT